MSTPSPGAKSKAVATWVAVVGGVVGLHRFYLYGLRDLPGWLFVPFAMVGTIGVLRMRALGGDDHVAWVLIPFLGAAISVAMVSAIVYGLTPDERWNARFNPVGSELRMGWTTVFGVVVALVLGAGVLMATLAFTAQRFFEYQAESVASRPLS